MTASIGPALPVRTSQQTFRLLLEAFSRPGTVHDLGPVMRDAGHKVSALQGLATVAMTLLDEAVRFAVAGEGRAAFAAATARATMARPTQDLSHAAYVFVLPGMTPRETDVLCREISCGTLETPHDGASLLFAVTAITGPDEEGFGQAAAMRLTGPGIPTEHRLRAVGWNPEWIDRRNTLTREPPLGVDIAWVDAGGRLTALPRSTVLERLGG